MSVKLPPGEKKRRKAAGRREAAERALYEGLRRRSYDERPGPAFAKPRNRFQELPDELEFMLAVDRYKRERGRPFPTWPEVLAVAKALGYRKPARKEV